MKAINSEYYGDDVRWFVATVIDGSPPRGLEGRIKVRIHGIHSELTSDIPQRDLPWAQVLMPGNTYGVSGLGTGCHILPGAFVFGFFLDGKHSQLPMVVGSMPRVEYPTKVQAESRDDPSSNPFAYNFEQSNAQMEDPELGEATIVSDCVSFFIDNGMNVKQASSIVATLESISGLNPAYDNNGFGIAGWVGHRYRRFENYIARLSPKRKNTDMEGQLQFVMQELHTTHTTAWSKLLRCKEIEGNLYGEKVDGIEEKGNGMIAILKKYYVGKHTYISQVSAEGKAESISKETGAR